MGNRIHSTKCKGSFASINDHQIEHSEEVFAMFRKLPIRKRWPFSKIGVAICSPFFLSSFFYSNNAVAENCQDRLDNKYFSCEVVSSDEDEFDACFKFISPSGATKHFDLDVENGAIVAACECKATTSEDEIKFHNTNWYHCVANDSGLSVSFEGLAEKKFGKILISKGQAVDGGGVSYYYKCKEKETDFCPAFFGGERPPIFGR